MLKINNLHVNVNNKEILKGLDLTVNPSEVHAIMGPNGSGKSTFGYALAGRNGYDITEGTVNFLGKSLLDLNVEERALAGLFLSFQYPTEIPGVNNSYFLRTAINNIRRQKGKEELDAMDFKDLVHDKMAIMKMGEKFLNRNVNEGFSGGEKKRNEILQMLLLEPKLAILDETDSGLDIDALQIVASGVNSMRDKNRSFILITHYQRLLNYIEPDYIHILANGKIIKSGGKELALELEEKGYSWIDKE